MSHYFSSDESEDSKIEGDVEVVEKLEDLKLDKAPDDWEELLSDEDWFKVACQHAYLWCNMLEAKSRTYLCWKLASIAQVKDQHSIPIITTINRIF